MRKKNYIHNVIRIRKGKPGLSQVYWFIVILNKKKASSHKVVEQLGFFRYGKKRLFTINYKRLAYFLNKGYKLKKSIKKFIYWNTKLYVNLKIKKKDMFKNAAKIKKIYKSKFNILKRVSKSNILKRVSKSNILKKVKKKTKAKINLKS